MADPNVMPTPQNPGAKNDMYSVSQLNTAADLTKKWQALKTARNLLEVQWKLNLAYYQGRQYTYYNKNAQRIEELPTSDGDKPRYRVRLKSNQIMPGTQGLLAKMTKTKPVLNATPGSSDPNDLRAAQMAERLLEFWWTDLKLDDKLEEALLWSIVASHGYLRTSWDGQAGKAMRFILDPQGNPITDSSLKSIYLNELAQLGIPREAVEKTFYMGDVAVESISPFNVLLDSTVTNFYDCKYCFIVSYMSPDEAKARYGEWLKPDSTPIPEDALIPTSGGFGNNALKTTCRVITGYFRPTPVLPKGRVVCWSDSNDKILDDQPWPFPSHELPLIKFGMLKIPGQLYDSSVVEHAIPLQQELNRTISQIVEYKNLTIKPRVWAPVGSMRERMTNEPGAIYQFTPIAGMKPEIETLPSMPPYVFEHLADISQRLKDAFYTSEIDGGTLPPNVEAFTAIDLLQEMSSDRIAPAIKLMEKSIGQLGQHLLGLAQQYYIEPRLLAIKGANGSTQVKEFTKADINGGVTISVEAGSGLPRTRAGRMAQIQALVEKGYISPQNGLKHMNVADLNGPLAAIASDEDQALREHDKIIEGRPVNADAVRQAMQTINTPDPKFGVPVNPDSGQPFTSAQEMQQYVHEQGLQPTHFEDYQTHREQHSLFMKSIEFEALPEQTQADFITHYDATYQIIRNLPLPNVKGPAVNMRINTTATPTVATEILNRAGIYDVQPEQFTNEAPLDSAVIDDTIHSDPQNVDPVQEAQAAAIQQESANKTAKTQADIAKTTQQMTHAEELHQQAHQHNHQAHHVKLATQKQAAKNKGKPSGSSK
jgi:hypothetical protein